MLKSMWRTVREMMCAIDQGNAIRHGLPVKECSHDHSGSLPPAERPLFERVA